MSEWKKLRLKEIAQIKGGKRLPAGQELLESITPYPYLRVTDMVNGGIYDSNLKYVSEEIQPYIKNYTISKDDLYVTIAGTIGSFGSIPDKLHNAQLTENAAKIMLFDFNKTNKVFLKYYLSSENIKSQINKEVGIGGGVPKLALHRIENLIVFIPEYPQQQKIARILSTVDAVIEKTEAAIAKYKAIKAGMMHDLFTRGINENGQLRPSYQQAPHLYKPSKLGWIPKEWEISNIEKSNVQIIDGDRGSNYPHEDELFEHGYCLFLNASNVTINGFVFLNKMFISKEKENILGSGKLERYDIVITTRGTVGNIAFYSDNVQFEHLRINSGMLILRNNEQGMFSEFLFQSFKNYLFDIDYRRVVSGSAQPQLPMKDLKAFHLIKPDETEQLKIINICKHYDNLLNSEIIYLEKMNQLKQGLMQDLLTGKITVSV